MFVCEGGREEGLCVREGGRERERELTFEVFLRAETCVREPLNSSHRRQPRPHMSTDLHTHTHTIDYLHMHTHKHTHTHSHTLSLSLSLSLSHTHTVTISPFLCFSRATLFPSFRRVVLAQSRQYLPR